MTAGPAERAAGTEPLRCPACRLLATARAARPEVVAPLDEAVGLLGTVVQQMLGGADPPQPRATRPARRAAAPATRIEPIAID